MVHKVGIVSKMNTLESNASIKMEKKEFRFYV